MSGHTWCWVCSQWRTPGQTWTLNRCGCGPWCDDLPENELADNFEQEDHS